MEIIQEIAEADTKFVLGRGRGGGLNMDIKTVDFFKLPQSRHFQEENYIYNRK